MKKIILASVVITLLSGCFITRIFQKKEKLGCPGDARNMSEQQINDRANKTKYKSNRKIY
ncbi:MAG: hypothetical protein ABIT07_11570 [Ferruginibacter sp.]